MVSPSTHRETQRQTHGTLGTSFTPTAVHPLHCYPYIVGRVTTAHRLADLGAKDTLNFPHTPRDTKRSIGQTRLRAQHQWGARASEPDVPPYYPDIYTRLYCEPAPEINSHNRVYWHLWTPHTVG